VVDGLLTISEEFNEYPELRTLDKELLLLDSEYPYGP
jgi:hypothetical protein